MVPGEVSLQPYAPSSAYENQIWCEKILVHVHLLVQNPVVEGGHHEVAAAGRDVGLNQSTTGG